MSVVAFRWLSDRLDILDQRQLPHQFAMISCRTPAEVAAAIKGMAVRGAPAIGCCAAYGMALAVHSGNGGEPAELLKEAAETLKAARPTAVNLAWAVDRMLETALAEKSLSQEKLFQKLVAQAERIQNDDLQANKELSRLGASLLGPDSIVLTHCNTGALATAGYGTALGIIREAHLERKIRKVYVDETRPYLQGARLTAWELVQEKIPHELITDSMAGFFMQRNEVNAVFVGCDRVAANGDTANKIGTYSLAVLARYHNVPFYVAMPVSTLDRKISSGTSIPIEERSSEEVVNVGPYRVAPRETLARHPAFDVTPAELITAIISEKGIARPPYVSSLSKLSAELAAAPNG